MKSKWIEHKGKNILYANFSGFKQDSEQLNKEVDSVLEIVCDQPELSVLLLVDVLDTVGTMKATEHLKHAARDAKSHLSKTAVIGITVFKRGQLSVISHFSGLKIVPFEDIEKAKDWLAE